MRSLWIAALFLTAGPPDRLTAWQCPDGTPPPCSGAARRATPVPTNTIAVLYFDNLSRDTGDVYLADGLTEELMSRLSQVEQLQVKSRTAVRRFRGRAMDDPAAVGRSLAVAHLVSGSVRRQQGRLRVTVELTRVATGNSVWARSYDRSAGDLMGTEAEIAESVAINVGARLAPAERRRIAARPTRNAEAYDHLIRGRYALSRRTAASMLDAIRAFEAALRLDPQLTPALVGLGRANMGLGSLYYPPGASVPRDTFVARGLAALHRAARADSMSADVWMALAASQDAAGNRAYLARAVALEPRNAEAHHTLGLTLRMLGEPAQSETEFRRALELEPDRAITLVNLGQLLSGQRRYAEARIWMDSAVALRPEAAFYYLEQAMLRLQLGDTAGARASAAAVAAHGNQHGRDEILARLDALAGDTASAQARMLAVDSALARNDCITSHDCLELSSTLAHVGLRERALAVLERIRPHGTWLVYWMTRPEFDPLRNEPRYQRVLSEARSVRTR